MNPPADREWEARYQDHDTPWEKGLAAPGLADFLVRQECPRERRVLVPGCGFGHDVRSFASSGWQATGMDIAPTAVRMANKLTRSAGLTANFQLGNFLRDPGETVYDWVFDHTFFCAIDPSDRDRYVTALRRWLRPGGQFLAIYYLIDDTEGPPFGTTRPEIMDRFGQQFRPLADWIPRSYPNRTGLEWMVHWRG